MARSELLILSGGSQAVLRSRARALCGALREPSACTALCAAAAARATEEHRLAVVGASEAELGARLRTYLAGAPTEGLSAGRVRPPEPLVFVFGGQGPEWWAMGRELYASEPVFAEAIRTCDEALRAHAATSIARELSVPEPESRLQDVEVLQPVLFALHVGLVQLLRAWGLRPDAVIGHSFGELSAAWAAGAISLGDAMRIHVARSAVMKRLSGRGRMAVVPAGEARVQPLIADLADAVAIGVVNSPASVVLAGEHAALDTAVARLAQHGITHRPVPMPYAVHAPAMRALMPEVARLLGGIAPAAPAIPLFSTVTGGAAGPLDALHWARNIGEPARFADAIDTVLARGPAAFVEIGPHPILGGVIAESPAYQAAAACVLPTLRRNQPERATLLATLGALAVRGHQNTLYAGIAGDEARLDAALAAASPEASEPPPLLHELRALDAPLRIERLVAHLQAHLRQRLAVDAVATDTPLRELGLDSATAVSLAAALGSEFGLHLPATLFFEQPTLTAAAQFLAGELGLSPRPAHPPAPTPAHHDVHEPIALIGIGCRFPGGADGPDALWRLLMAEVDAVTEVPLSRWDVRESFDADPEARGKTYSKWGGFLTDVDRFDARFFGIAPREAQSMDPQQRLLLEVSWEALEHAALSPAALAGSRTGVFVGLCTSDYGGALLNGDPRDIDAYTFTGNSASVAAGRIAYVLGLQGPALTLDTACSSSLAALHLACRSLRARECDVALAGGVNLVLSKVLMIYFSRLRALSPTGRSRAFDAAADGYVRGEGCGVVALKRLSDARAAGDRVIALIRGSALNQDGRSSGLTAPSGSAQQAVVRAALADARIAPASVGYVEAHGTGTPLGDPIELRALGAVLGEGRPAGQKVRVGSIKTNIGHTEGAAGIAGVIKAALALRHGKIPRSLHFRTPNPHVPWSELPLQVADATSDWIIDTPRIAGVSSFGFSGTNAHVVLQEADPEESDAGAPPATPLPLLLSARSEPALRAQIARLQSFIAHTPEVRLADVARTLATGRTHFEHRAGLLAKSRDGLLAALAAGHFASAEARGGGLALLFTGQGSQRARMGAALHARFPVFRDALDEVLAALAGQMERPLAPLLFAEEAPALDETRYTQPALFALEVALARLFLSLGAAPRWLAGHSVGEIAAAHVAGVLGLADACRLVAARGRLMDALPRGGAMVALDATEDAVRPLLDEGAVALAAVNGPRAVVLSGDEPAVLRAADALVARGHRARRLRVSHAFHSPRMDPMLDALAGVAASLSFAPPRIPIVSTVTGRLAGADELCRPAYWVRQARATVRFADAVRTLADAGAGTCLEVGPDGVLSALAAECLPQGHGVGLVPSLRKGTEDGDALAGALLQLHVRGVAVDWEAVFAGLGGRRIALPTYPFQRDRHWTEARQSPSANADADADAGPHPLLAQTLPVAATDGYLLTGRLAPDTQPWLAAHRVAGRAILPGTAFLELALEAARRIGSPCVEELTIEAPLVLAEAEAPPSSSVIELQVSVLAPDAAGHRPLTLHARQPGATWQRHASGRLGPARPAPSARLEPWPPPGSVPVALDGMYADLAAVGLAYGAEFQRVAAAFRRDGELFVEVKRDDARPRFALDPILLDAALHPLVRDALPAGLELPFSFTGVSLHARGATSLRVRLTRTERAIVLEAADGHGQPVASVAALVTRPVAAERAEHLHRVVWSDRELPGARAGGEWALVGDPLPGLPALLGAAGLRYRCHPSAAALLAALDRAPAPAVVAYHERAGDAPDACASTARALAFLQRTLADARLTQTRLALLTCGALAAGPGDAVPALAHAGLAGLVRSARAEHPARTILHVDLDGDARSLALLPRALASSEAQLALRGGLARTAQLIGDPARLDGKNRFASDGAVLITGGTGALGGLVARHLATRHHVRELVLASRRGDAAPGAAPLREALERAGARVTFHACDLANPAEVAALLDTIPRLRGVIHAAGTLDDGLLPAIDERRLARVFSSKVDAALTLDRLTRGLPLDCFVLFSSVAALLGPAGQASYAAANAVLDALAQQRRAAGLPALSVGFGPWAEAGMAARLGAADQARLGRLGLGALTTAAALSGLDAALATGDAHVAVAVLGRAAAPPERRDRDELLRLPPAERERALRTWVRSEAARVLGLSSPAELPWEQPLRELGMDSLSVVELRNALAARVGQPLPATLAFDYPHVAALAQYLLARIAPAESPAAPPTPAEKTVDEMTEAELDALLSTLKESPRP